LPLRNYPQHIHLGYTFASARHDRNTDPPRLFPPALQFSVAWLLNRGRPCAPSCRTSRTVGSPFLLSNIDRASQYRCLPSMPSCHQTGKGGVLTSAHLVESVGFHQSFRQVQISPDPRQGRFVRALLPSSRLELKLEDPEFYDGS
jgi:hypothetical protein